MQTYKDLPTQFLRPTSKITANIVIGSFGSSTPYNSQAFALSIPSDPDTPPAATQKAPRYGKLEEIHHIFRGDPKSPNVLISTVFGLGSIAALPLLLGAVSKSQVPSILIGRHANNFTVAIPRRKHQPPPEGPVRRSDRTCPFRWLDHLARRHSLPLLLELEPLPGTTSSCNRRTSHVRQRKPSPH